jgi:hypothetical protein
MITTARVLASGSLASVAAAAALAFASKTEGRSATAPINATSHWLHGDRAAACDELDVEYTGVGYATHHAAAIFWAGLFEVLRRQSGRSALPVVARDAAVASAAAVIIDYVFTPHRFTPGWELVLSKRSIAFAYAAMAAAYITSELLLPKRQQGR